jgi:hypothetical protein
MEYIPGGELFTYLREEGIFEVSKARYEDSHSVSMLLR